MNQDINASELDAIVSETFGTTLATEGFELVKPRKWVRSGKAPIREMFVVQAMKGGSVAPHWGFSLDFVPHLSESGWSLHWHRTPKMAMLDMRYDPIDYSADSSEWCVSKFDGLEGARSKSEHLSRRAVGLALEWFDSVNSILDLVREFEAKRARPFVRFGFHHYAQEPLAYAFILARSGRMAEAEAVLTHYIDRKQLSGTIAEVLRRSLADQRTG